MPGDAQKLNPSVCGSLHSSRDVDWYWFDIGQGDTYDISLDPTGDATITVYTFDPQTNEWFVVQNTSSTECHHASTFGGRYYVEVTSPGHHTQSYVINRGF